MKNIGRSLILIISLLGSFNANALLIKLDFSSNTSMDMWGNVTESFDVTQAGFQSSDFTSITQNILNYVREDFYSSAYGFIASNQQLDIDFMIALASTDVSAIDANNHTIQIGSRVSGPHNGFGVACLSCVSSNLGANSYLFGSVFSNNIFSGLLGTAGGSWDLVEVTNAIAGTLSHEIGHSLGLSHPSGAETNPGESTYGLVATGAGPSYMPSSERLKNRAFSNNSMAQLVDNIGLRVVSTSVPEPSSVLLLLTALLFIYSRQSSKA